MICSPIGVISNKVENPILKQVQKIQETVSKFYEIKIRDLKSAKRTKKMILARKMAIYLMREHLNLSFQEIGVSLGNRDHSTILHSFKNFSKMLNENGSIRTILKNMQNQLEN